MLTVEHESPSAYPSIPLILTCAVSRILLDKLVFILKTKSECEVNKLSLGISFSSGLHRFSLRYLALFLNAGFLCCGAIADFLGAQQTLAKWLIFFQWQDMKIFGHHGWIHNINTCLWSLSLLTKTPSFLVGVRPGTMRFLFVRLFDFILFFSVQLPQLFYRLYLTICVFFFNNILSAKSSIYHCLQNCTLNNIT